MSPAGLIRPPAAPGAARPDDARLLADWTRLDPRGFSEAFSSIRYLNPQLPAPNVAALTPADDPDITEDKRPILALCRAAQRAGVLDKLCISVAGLEEDKYARPRDDVQAILSLITANGKLQGVTNRARGKASPLVFYKLSRIFEATGYIECLSSVQGTAFLVKNNMVLTAAHVVLKCRKDDGVVQFGPELAEGLHVVFPATPDGRQVANFDAVTPLLACAPPYYTSSGELIREISGEAGERLDFALLQLDRPIQGVEPVPIDGIAEPRPHLLSFVIGYPGGTDPGYDADQIIACLPAGSRIIHMMNTFGGMSGSCVVGEAGIPVGLHEGGLDVLDPQTAAKKLNDDGTLMVQNRAVLLHAISQAIARRTPNPLTAKPALPGVALYQQRLIDRLKRRGVQLANDAVRASWESIFAIVTADDGGKPWTLHPWFSRASARRAMERWMEAALLPRVRDDRLLFISGPEGCGKTFSIDILAALLSSPLQDLVRIDWVDGGATLAQISAFLATAPVDTGDRTSDAQRRYDTIPELVEGLAGYGGRDRARDPAAPPLFLAIDAGKGTDTVTAADSWVQFVVALLAQPWARVVLCGLPAALQLRIVDTLQRDPATVDVCNDEIRLEHAGEQDILAFLRACKQLDGTPFADPEALAKAFLDPDELHHACEPLTTASAALLCIALLRGLLGTGTPETGDAPAGPAPAGGNP